MIRNVFIDLDDTILDFKKAEAIALSRTLKAFEIEPTPERIETYSAINRAQWELLEEGKITRPQVLVRRFRLFFEALGREDYAAAPAMYEGFLGEGHYFVPGAEQMLKTLAGRYRLYLATNGIARVQAGRLASAGILPYFSGCFVSEEVGYDKPSREFFLSAFATIPDFRPEETVMVGDSMTSDMRGANNAGIRAIWFRRPGKMPLPDVKLAGVYEDPRELPDLLLRLEAEA